MKTQNVSVFLLTAILSLGSAPFFAARAALSIDLITTFNYPMTGVQTRPQKINSFGDIAGEIIFSTGETRGFARFRNGTFTPPIIEPNDDSTVTDVRAINDSRVIAGYYIQDNFAHSFFFDHGTFTEFNLPGALNTYTDALTNAGDFSGTADFSSGNQGFISVAGNVTLFAVPGAVTTQVYGQTNNNEADGAYTDAASIFHGFFRDANGVLTFPIDPAGSTQTFLFGINDRGAMVGRSVDDVGVTHGLLFMLPNRFVFFDYPGSTFTSLNGINNDGVICGRYLDNVGVEHGLILRVRRTSSE